METISYNPGTLQEIATAFKGFDEAYRTSKEKIEGNITSLEESWEGPDAQEAFAMLKEIREALDRIDTASEKTRGLVSAKSESFGEIKF